MRSGRVIGSFGIHQGVVTQLSRLLGNALESTECQALPLVELDWVITQDTVVRPDVMVVCGPVPERHCESTPTLVAEVLSDSTRTNDLHFKRQLYQQQGVGVILMLDFHSRSVEIDRRLADGSYLTEHCQARLDLKLYDDCEIEIDVAKIFRT